MTYEEIKDILLILLPPISALAGVWLTSILSERQKDRNFAASEVMKKKTEVYEGFYALLNSYDTAVSDIFQRAKSVKSAKELADLKNESFPIGMAIMEYVDRRGLYIDENVTIHIGATIMAPASLSDLNPEDKQYEKNLSELTSNYRESYKQGIDLIKDYMGIKRLEKSFKKINKPSTQSPFVKYAEELKKTQKNN